MKRHYRLWVEQSFGANYTIPCCTPIYRQKGRSYYSSYSGELSFRPRLPVWNPMPACPMGHQMRLFLCHAWKDCHYLCTVGWLLKSSTAIFCLLFRHAGLFILIDIYFLYSLGTATQWHQSTIDDYSFRDKLHTIVTVFSIVLLHWYSTLRRGISPTTCTYLDIVTVLTRGRIKNQPIVSRTSV